MNSMYDILNKMKLLEGKGSKPDFLDLDKDGDKKEPMKKAAKEVDESVEEGSTGDYSAKKARAGKDIGKPGKTFAKIAKGAAERYGSKERGEKVAGAVLAKLRKGVKEDEVGEGNDFTGARLAAIRAGKPTFKVGDKTYKVTGDTSDEKVMEREYGQRDEFDRYAKAGDTIRTTKGTLTKTATGVKHAQRPADDEEVAADAPKRGRGRPKGPAKGPERVTSKAWKHKGGRVKESELEEDRDEEVDAGEYGREGDMAKEQMHTIEAAAQELSSILSDEQDLPEWVQKKITLAMDYIDTARDYMKSQGGEAIAEKAPPGAKAERMVTHIKKGYAKDGKLTDREKAIAYATAWKAKKAGKVEEESTESRDERAEKAGRKVAKDIEYDEKVKDKIHGKKRGSEDDKAERAGKKVTKDIEHDEKVDETTVAGSVATAPAPKGKKGGMVFGKGVYEGRLEESYKSRLEQMLTEGMSVNASQSEDGHKSLTVTATEEDAVKLAHILQLAGMPQASGYEEACPACGQSPCGCEEELEEANLANSPDPVYADTEMIKDQGDDLHKRKSTGQTTLPTPYRGIDRQQSMAKVYEEVKADAEKKLWDLYKRYENK